MDPRDPTTLALRIDGLRKRFGAAVAVDGLDLAVARGEIVGLIGPDGAGKTTTMRLVLGLLRPDEGRMEILGDSAAGRSRALKTRLGYMPQRFSLYPDLTVAENLRFFADMYLVPPDERTRQEAQLLEFSRLGPFRNRRAGDLSGGMKQKLALSCNLVHKPELLILDEPTTGVDPVSRQEFWGFLRDFAREGLAILVSTPYMDEAELCDRVLLMHLGRVLARGTPAQVTALFPDQLVSVRAADPTGLARQLAALDLPGIDVVRFGDTLHIAHTTAAGDPLRQALAGLGLEATPLPPTIEDVFVALVGRGGERHAEVTT